MKDDMLDVHLDAILRASGSALRHYSLAKTKDDMRAALRAAIGPERPVAPWTDFIGQEIRHGDRLIHPTGQGFTAVRLQGYENDGDAWRAVYDDAGVSRLGLQIGDKGRAVLERTAEL